MEFSRIITCIDAHTCGEPLRIITSGFPVLPGASILEKREYVNTHYDGLRRMLMLEPRGHSGMYGAILTPPVTPDGDLGVLFCHNEGLSSMCGHGIIGLTKVAFETGMFPMKDGENTLKIDSPAGRITAFADVINNRVKAVRFQNVPCFVYNENITVNVEGLGEVTGDIVYCGAFYVYVDATSVGTFVAPENSQKLVEVGMAIKHAVMEKYPVSHPTDGIDWLYGTILMNPLERSGNTITARNICIFADGQIDRSPTGTGTGGRVALHVHKGQMSDDDVLVNLSVIDTPMEGRVVSHTEVSGYNAVLTEVSGSAYIMGFNNIVLDPEDPLPEGFRIIGN